MTSSHPLASISSLSSAKVSAHQEQDPRSMAPFCSVSSPSGAERHCPFCPEHLNRWEFQSTLAGAEHILGHITPRTLCSGFYFLRPICEVIHPAKKFLQHEPTHVEVQCATANALVTGAYSTTTIQEMLTYRVQKQIVEADAHASQLLPGAQDLLRHGQSATASDSTSTYPEILDAVYCARAALPACSIPASSSADQTDQGPPPLPAWSNSAIRQSNSPTPDLTEKHCD